MLLSSGTKCFLELMQDMRLFDTVLPLRQHCMLFVVNTSAD
ncbi:hypothetical protein XM79_c11882 [Vibrio vulnificus]|nr:hypothetical protein XM72_c11992 [Vibrio vulnificus]OQK62909.1 hypothetical protein XM78_c11905 [Vibrio vulnificus]OQK65017.1 hypothetical protein XM79_c11882 [Vibrio vulnificus]